MMSFDKAARPGARRWFLAAMILIAVCSSCSSDSSDGSQPSLGSHAPDKIIATILLTPGKLTLVGARAPKADELPPKRASEQPLDWRFETETGTVLASGRINHPALVRSEFDHGSPDPKRRKARAGTFEVELPNVDGYLVLSPPGSTAGGTHPQGLWDDWTESLKVFIKKVIDVAEDTLSDVIGIGPDKTWVGPTEQVVTPASSCQAYSLLIVAEGYVEDEQAKFESDAQRVIDVMKKKDGFAQNWKFMSVWRTFFESRESGVSDIEAGVDLDTAFALEAKPSERLLAIGEDVRPDTLAKLSAAKAKSQSDVVLVLVNTNLDVGSASSSERIGYFAVDHEDEAGLVAGHELGHALFGLDDEYEDGECDPASRRPLGPNVAEGAPYPWADLMTPGVDIPTLDIDPSIVGAYEGALYCSSGVYRSQLECFMRDLDSPFCEACKHYIDNSFKARTPSCQPPPKERCGHDECNTGASLSSQCSACTHEVCLQLPECCDPSGSWDAACVEAAQNLPGACRAVCAKDDSACTHDECAAGEALDPGCGTCAKAICERDSFCCTDEWDDICASEAEQSPFCGCGS